MKVTKIWCECGKRYGITEIQMADFEAGICEPLNCLTCNKPLLPSTEEVNCLMEEMEIPGKDPGWDPDEWDKRAFKIFGEFKDSGIRLFMPAQEYNDNA